MGGILTSLLLVFCVFTLLSISEVSAEDVISVNAESYQNTIIIEFKNDGTSKIKTVKIWLGGDATFKSFKTEPGWGGGEYSDGKMLIFTATNTLNLGESVKFGFTTNEKIDGINWKTLDQNEQQIDTRKTPIQEISHTDSNYAIEESESIDDLKDTGSTLYGSKKFIPENIRVGSDVRLVGNGFGSEKNLQIYLDSTMIKSVKTDIEGNFLTTISIPDTQKIGTSEFIIKNESGDFQSSNIKIEEQKNRFLRTTQFEINDITEEVTYDQVLTVSGNAYPKSAIILKFENIDEGLEKIRVITSDSNGVWVFEETINRTESIGEKYLVFQNNQYKTTKNLTIKSDFTIEISTTAKRYNAGETVSITGNSEPNKNTIIWIKDQNKKIIFYDVFTTNADGSLNYELVTDTTFSDGTYTVIVKQEDGSDATLFGISQYPTKNLVVLMDKTNFALNSKAILSVVGPPSAKLSITILDSNDNIKITDSMTLSSVGKNKYTVDLDDISSGVYRAVISSTNIQDSTKFSVGLEQGSGDISLVTTQTNYTPGDSVLVIGKTGSNARLTITLFEPSGKVSSQFETFSDGAGNFSTESIGIPYNAILGDWKITAQSRLDSNSIDIKVNIPTNLGITLQIEESEFSIGNVVIIKGIALSDSNRLYMKITDQSDQVIITLETPITSDNTFSLPWTIPNGFDAGTYIINVHDSVNSAEFEILVL
jgi:hypothetical protein